MAYSLHPYLKVNAAMLLSHFSGINMQRTTYERETTTLARRVNCLQEPYRENAIEWLRSCTRKPMDNLHEDIESFLYELNPLERTFFIRNTDLILAAAERFFNGAN